MMKLIHLIINNIPAFTINKAWYMQKMEFPKEDILNHNNET